MACNTCNTKFNFFHKELGCANCGMSFCSKCLKQKCKIPSKGSSEMNVCKICFNKIIKTNEPVELSFEPPDTFLRRLENLENPSAPPITVYKQNTNIQTLRTGLTPADQNLVDRLEKLKEKESKSEPPSETELRERLAQLKGKNYNETSEKCWMFPVDNRTNQEKVDGLLEQFSREHDIELDHNQQEEIEGRLAALREKGISPNEGVVPHSDSDDSGEEVEKITRKIMEEVALDDKSSKYLRKDVSNSEGKEEMVDSASSADMLPWCVLCNDDAQFRCLDCGGDLYCEKCNREVHKEWERDHQVVPFIKK